MTRRARCRVCGFEYQVKRDGTLRLHRPQLPLAWVEYDAHCPGSNTVGVRGARSER